MFSAGLVLGAGGVVGDPWHCGVLSRLASTTGWDARGADLIIGTSAGAFTAVGLRAGVSAHDRVARFRGEQVSAEAAEIYARVTTDYDEPTVERDWRPLSPRMSLNALWPPWSPDPVRAAFGAIPRGTRSGAASEQRMNELHPDRWTELPTWIVAVRASDGRRIVFGRDDVRGNIGQAARASSAVPGVYVPAQIGKVEYIDGGVHSSTNADLCEMLGFDLVIISSAMTGGTGVLGRVTNPMRSWFSSKLRDEVSALRRQGTAVVVVEPHSDALQDLQVDSDDQQNRAVRAGEAAVDRLLETPTGAGLDALIRQAQHG
ncbi:MAG: patatin-like phospholipase family protein [Acidimicrobiaceae bacterium]|nr:patatin-like phospholipase family protein [Acidimicrobiaceae bacterium]MDE0605618.1 patatin-like phospholipase family protein [Acidimicrobiaceae bacterium]